MASGDIICHKCFCHFKFEDVEWFEPSDPYEAAQGGYWVCPLCDYPLDESNLEEYKNWKS